MFTIFTILSCLDEIINANMMKHRRIFNKSTQAGAAMLVSVVFFIFIAIAIIGGLVAPVVREFKNANDSVLARQSYYLSESGVEDAYFRLKNAIPIDSSTILTLNGYSATTAITDSGHNEKTVVSLGDVNLRQRTTELILETGDGVSFKYGIQAGVGGFELGNAIINGNVYSNGTIVGANGATITGSAFSAGGLIDNIDVGLSTSGEARANEVRDSNVGGNLYCQVGSGNNKPCNTSQANPAPVNMPITQAMIDDWKADAELGGTVTGDVTISTETTLGPKKIVGNLAINNDLVINGTIYVTGNITTNNNAEISLASSYGDTGGIIITDGRVVLSNNVQFFGSGQPDTYVLLVTTSICPTGCSGNDAIDILNNVGAILVSAQNGTVHLHNNVSLSEVVGNKIVVNNNAVVNYTIGLANTSFTSGPSGGWNIKNWEEIE